MKLFHIVGARPQFVKAAMVSRSWKSMGEEYLLHTGQHYDENMSKLFFTDLVLRKPDANLNIGSENHALQTAAMLEGIDKIISNESPDIVVIYGDTNSTLAGALAASKRNIPLAHVEAGLRSYNRAMPEEVNRVLSDHTSNWLFCPTQQAVKNLKKEGITNGVYQVGDVMADALDIFSKISEKKSKILESLEVKPEEFALATIHRKGNVDNRDRLASLLEGLAGIRFPIILPLHPRTRKMIGEFQLRIAKNIRVLEPIGYLDMLQLERNADCIITDSGGVQKEAYIFGIRCITMREETEWVETVSSGWNKLVGWNSKLIVKSFETFHPSGERPEHYGNCHASDKIAQVLNLERQAASNGSIHT